MRPIGIEATGHASDAMAEQVTRGAFRPTGALFLDGTALNGQQRTQDGFVVPIAYAWSPGHDVERATDRGNGSISKSVHE